ncbi:hypothetical protein A9K75_07880 [Campylobacter fetus subsp. testudinum]|uniref:hypothetical protein n=1 Tax=Campylobacter fetus TaxID=196 RepID=UPI000818B90F|nr:hypothetical protein [Campylobacter fetus]OCR99236.1 hypothetical protein A9K75_07880 [Campylobacter fetus subsp. testudinum]
MGCSKLVSNFSILKDRINPSLIRKISELDDSSLQMILSVYLCDLIGGLKQLPTKMHRIELAKELIKAEVSKDGVIKLCGISKAAYFKLKKANYEQ